MKGSLDVEASETDIGFGGISRRRCLGLIAAGSLGSVLWPGRAWAGRSWGDYKRTESSAGAWIHLDLIRIQLRRLA